MLYTLSEKQFAKKLQERKFEKAEVIRGIEKLLKKQRGYIFRMPMRGSPVILLLSGGLDSVTSWGILMEEFGLNVYPISFDKHEKRAIREKESIKYFSDFYKKRYPRLYHSPFRIKLGGESLSIPIEKALDVINPSVIMNYFVGEDWLRDINVSIGSFLLLPVYGRILANYLYFKENLQVRTIFCSVNLGDGAVIFHQTVTAMRSMMFYLCAASGDYSWQFTSALIEKENGLCLDKSDVIRWAYKHEIPLEHTWSCYFAKRFQCGDDCVTCRVRRFAFRKAHVPDYTIYKPLSEQVFKYPLSRHFEMYRKELGRIIKKSVIDKFVFG